MGDSGIHSCRDQCGAVNGQIVDRGQELVGWRQEAFGNS